MFYFYHISDEAILAHFKENRVERDRLHTLIRMDEDVEEAEKEAADKIAIGYRLKTYGAHQTGCSCKPCYAARKWLSEKQPNVEEIEEALKAWQEVQRNAQIAEVESRAAKEVKKGNA